MATIEQNIKQAIADLDSVKSALESNGVEVPYGTDTSEYGKLAFTMGKDQYNKGFANGYAEAKAVPGYPEYRDIPLYKTANPPNINGKFYAGEYAFSVDAGYTSGDKAPQAKYYLAWTDADLYYAVEMKIAASDLTDAQKADLINSIGINVYIYRGDYRNKTADDPEFMEYTTEFHNGTFNYRYYSNVLNQWKTHKDGSTRLVYTITENQPEGYYTVMLEYRFQMDDTVVFPTSSGAGVYTIGSVVNLKDGKNIVGQSYFAPGVEEGDTYTMGYYVATLSNAEVGGSNANEIS